MSGLLMVLCPLAIVATGGVAWVLTRLPGVRAGRIARLARRSTCLPLSLLRHNPQTTSTTSTRRTPLPMREHTPRPVFARIYAKVAEIGERRGGAER
jgi:hypothetical protein